MTSQMKWGRVTKTRMKAGTRWWGTCVMVLHICLPCGLTSLRLCLCLCLSTCVWLWWCCNGSATAAAKVMYSIIEESLSDMAFVCGLRTCNQLVNDYREIFHVWRTKTRTRMRKQFIRDRKAALAAGGCPVMTCWGRSVLTSVCARFIS